MIYSSSKLFLVDIKRVFEIKNKIITTKEPGTVVLIFGKSYITKGVYSLSLGSELLEIMWKTFPNSLARKRHNNKLQLTKNTIVKNENSK